MRTGPDSIDHRARTKSLTVAGHQITLLPAMPYEIAFMAETNTIGFAFDGQSGRHAIDSDRLEKFQRLPNSIALTPAGCEIRSGSRSGGEYLQVGGAEVTLSGRRYQSNLLLPSALPAAFELRKWVLSGQVPDELTTESWLMRFTGGALRRQGPDKAARWMTPRRFDRITGQIEADLESVLTIAGLAGSIGVSPSFLSRAFAAFCGQSPYDYILSRRVQRARRLIETTGLPLAEIAAAAGFASQSHMTSVFRRRLGITPGEVHRSGGTG